MYYGERKGGKCQEISWKKSNIYTTTGYENEWMERVDVKFVRHFFFLVFKKIFIFESSGGGAEREGDTESELGSRLWDVSTEPDVGLEPTDSWPELRLDT